MQTRRPPRRRRRRWQRRKRPPRLPRKSPRRRRNPPPRRRFPAQDITKGRPPGRRAALLLSRAPRGEFKARKKQRRRSPRSRGGISTAGGRHRPPGSLLAGSYAVQTFLVAEHQEPSLVREQGVALHLVDQRGDERARGADQIRQVLLGNPVQAELVSGGDPLAVRL